MGDDDRSADRQSHPRSAGLCGIERLENALNVRRINAWPGITYCEAHACTVLRGANRQISLPVNRSHCFDRIEDQVQNDLLKLNAIAMSGRQTIRQWSLNRDAIFDNRALRQR